jgi:hypothetical protein
MSDGLVKELHTTNLFDADGWESGLGKEAADEINRLRAENMRLEAKLANAVEALEKVQDFVRDLEPYADQGHTLVPALREACEILEASAEKGEDKGDDNGKDKGSEKGEADTGKGGRGKGDKGKDGDDD